MVADAAGPTDGQTVLFLHGSGQSRGSWRKALLEAARRGFRAIAPDLRGHGDSDWSPDGVYSLELLVADLRNVIRQAGGEPVLVGTSAGATMSMIVAASPPPPVRATVLIDISPTPQMEGIAEVRAFMGSAREGFASLEEAADAVAAYLPQRSRPNDTRGLERNLRFRDGRYYWHWDPEVFFQMSGAPTQIEKSLAALRQAAKTLTVPTLYVRGGKSNVVTEEGARAFLELVPHAQYANIAGAHHMVAGDANDAFNDAVSDFIGGLS
ncbi:MAG: alpha/beta hydrolase [Novosphingobium sp.]|nr:alpha/beta hydrolase [Novosphingobium sp.]MCP5402544.1 alpha/beta hydrolase [Novosphingobium sp.]